MTLSEVSISNHRSFCTVGGSFIDRRYQPLNFHETIYGHRFFEAQLGDAYHIGVCMMDTDPDKKGAAG